MQSNVQNANEKERINWHHENLMKDLIADHDIKIFNEFLRKWDPGLHPVSQTTYSTLLYWKDYSRRLTKLGKMQIRDSLIGKQWAYIIYLLMPADSRTATHEEQK